LPPALLVAVGVAWVVLVATRLANTAAVAVAAVTWVAVVRPIQRLTAVAAAVVSSVLEEVSPAYLAALAALENLAAAAAVDNKAMGALPDTVREQVAVEKLPMAATPLTMHRPVQEARQRAAAAVKCPMLQWQFPGLLWAAAVALVNAAAMPVPVVLQAAAVGQVAATWLVPGDSAEEGAAVDPLSPVTVDRAGQVVISAGVEGTARPPVQSVVLVDLAVVVEAELPMCSRQASAAQVDLAVLVPAAVAVAPGPELPAPMQALAASAIRVAAVAAEPLWAVPSLSHLAAH
jgi:hypothetical protein